MTQKAPFSKSWQTEITAATGGLSVERSASSSTAVKMEATGTSETLISIYQTAHDITEERLLKRETSKISVTFWRERVSTRFACRDIHEWNRNSRKVEVNDVAFGTLRLKKQAQAHIQTDAPASSFHTGCHFYCQSHIFGVFPWGSLHAAFERSTLHHSTIRSRI